MLDIEKTIEKISNEIKLFKIYLEDMYYNKEKSAVIYHLIVLPFFKEIINKKNISVNTTMADINYDFFVDRKIDIKGKEILTKAIINFLNFKIYKLCENELKKMLIKLMNEIYDKSENIFLYEKEFEFEIKDLTSGIKFKIIEFKNKLKDVESLIDKKQSLKSVENLIKNINRVKENIKEKIECFESLKKEYLIYIFEKYKL